MKASLPYPPPFMDAATLCAHICIAEGTIDNWIRSHGFPPAKMRGGKRYWRWSEVEAWMDGQPSIVPEEQALLRRVYDATKAAANG